MSIISYFCDVLAELGFREFEMGDTNTDFDGNFWIIIYLKDEVAHNKLIEAINNHSTTPKITAENITVIGFQLGGRYDMSAVKIKVNRKEMETFIKNTIPPFKPTPIDLDYWGKNGSYQTLMDEVSDRIPPEVVADTLHTELVRCINSLSYEYYNNGNCNAVYEENSVWEVTRRVDLFYKELIVFIDDHLRCSCDYPRSDTVQDLIRELRYSLLNSPEECDEVYTKLTDEVMYFVTITKDRPLTRQEKSQIDW